MEGDWVLKLLVEAEKRGQAFSSEVTSELVEAARRNDPKTIARILTDFDLELAVLDRAVVAAFVNGQIEKPRGRPTDPNLPSSMLCLSLILEHWFGYEKEGARVLRLSELTGRSENSVRGLIQKNDEWFRLAYTTLFSHQKRNQRTIDHIVGQFGKAGIAICQVE